jgi:hypothetical protein
MDPTWARRARTGPSRLPTTAAATVVMPIPEPEGGLEGLGAGADVGGDGACRPQHENHPGAYMYQGDRVWRCWNMHPSGQSARGRHIPPHPPPQPHAHTQRHSIGRVCTQAQRTGMSGAGPGGGGGPPEARVCTATGAHQLRGCEVHTASPQSGSWRPAYQGPGDTKGHCGAHPGPSE